MHLPRRSVKSIQPLPSIHTAFPVNNDINTSSEHSGRCLIRRIDDGIEMVPFERRNSLSAPILSPDQGEKEVLVAQQKSSPHDKPLPTIPKSLWARLSVKQRMVAIIGVQIATLLTVSLALLAAKRRSPDSEVEATAHTTGGDFSNPRDMASISPGQYALPISMSQSRDASCLALMNESVAWQCASETVLQLSILPPPGNSNAMFVQLGSPPPSPNGTLYYGHQGLDAQPIPLSVAPSDAGTITHTFRTTYNRVVLLKESDFTSWAQPAERRPMLRNGDTVWRCVFDKTTIEGYLYTNRTTASRPLNTTETTTTQDLPKIPHVIKLVERRMPSGQIPYCDRMKMVNGDTLAAPADARKTTLSLADPAADALLNKSAKFRARQQSTERFCSCQWTIQ